MWASLVLLVVKNLPANAGSIPESGRSPGEGNGYPLQYSYLKNPIYRGALWAIVHRVSKSQTRLKQLSMHALENQTLIHLGGKYPLNIVCIHGLSTYMVPMHSPGTYTYSYCCLLPLLLPCLAPINISINYGIKTIGSERGQTDWNHNHRQLANLITWATALSNSMKLSHAVWGHARLMSHGGEVW